MECRFCGQGFDTSRGLHVHQAQAHDDVKKEIRKFLDSSPEEIAESLDETELDTEELIEAEQRLADRDEVLHVLAAEDSLSPEDMDEKIGLIEDMEKELESSVKDDEASTGQNNDSDESKGLNLKEKIMKRIRGRS